MIKPTFIFLLIANYFSITSFSQPIEEKKKAIRKIFQQINKNSALKSYQLEGEDFLEHATDRGGSLIGYFKSDTLVKITEWIGLSSSNKQFEYYFNKEGLVFVYAEEQHFKFNDSSQELDYSKPEKVHEGRFYFNNGKIISSETKGIGKWEDSKILEQTLVESADKYLGLLKKRFLTNPPSSH
ncbi:MAG: hypothetical protein HYR66_18200 [Sphingobacteriales bacterium]|nr:hypothetical protein [Sphingobacteriales bacterium]MBI3718813.1 hypothetical protein [Sphingobacteriales bacterium]